MAHSGIICKYCATFCQKFCKTALLKLHHNSFHLSGPSLLHGMFETSLHVGVEAEREAIYTTEIQNKSPARQQATELPRINLQLSGA